MMSSQFVRLKAIVLLAARPEAGKAVRGICLDCPGRVRGFRRAVPAAVEDELVEHVLESTFEDEARVTPQDLADDAGCLRRKAFAAAEFRVQRGIADPHPVVAAGRKPVTKSAKTQRWVRAFVVEIAGDNAVIQQVGEDEILTAGRNRKSARDSKI